MSKACPECGRIDDSEEVTLADLVDTLRGRKKVFALTFAVVLLGSMLFTLMEEPLYESTAIIVAANEREELLALINSPIFEEAVRDFNGNVMDISGTIGPLDVPANQRKEITIAFRGEGADIQGAGRQALLVLEGLQDELRDVTWSKNWPEYFEDAGKDDAEATMRLQALVDGMTYYHVLAEPGGGSKVSPNTQLNLAVGIILGLMLAVFGVFGLEWWESYRARAKRKAPNS